MSSAIVSSPYGSASHLAEDGSGRLADRVGRQVVQAMIGAASVWYDGKAFGGPENAKKVYKYHR